MSPPPSPGNPRTALIIVAGIVGGALFIGCALGAVFYLEFVHKSEEPMTQADHDVLLTAEKLSAFLETKIDPAIGRARRVRYFDGSLELFYEYLPPEGTTDPLLVGCRVMFERNVSDAHVLYADHLAAVGGPEVFMPGLFQWGDESKAVVLMRERGKPGGNIFVGRKGAKVFQVSLHGIYFDEREKVDAALGPVLRRLEAYNP